MESEASACIKIGWAFKTRLQIRLMPIDQAQKSFSAVYNRVLAHRVKAAQMGEEMHSKTLSGITGGK